MQEDWTTIGESKVEKYHLNEVETRMTRMTRINQSLEAKPAG